MNKALSIVVVAVCVLVLESLAAPQGDYRSELLNEDNTYRKAPGNVLKDQDAKKVIGISEYQQSQSPTESKFRYVGSDGTSRQETITLEKVTNGSKEALVPLAVGETNYTHEGTNIFQSYSSGRGGNSYSIIWNGKQK